MKLYRKKPVMVFVQQFTQEMADLGFGLPVGVQMREHEESLYTSGPTGPENPVYKEYFINTLEGNMTVSVGDYVITGVKGERYPCKPDIFELTYEAVEL